LGVEAGKRAGFRYAVGADHQVVCEPCGSILFEHRFGRSNCFGNHPQKRVTAESA
jgi:hypothetical protein